MAAGRITPPPGNSVDTLINSSAKDPKGTKRPFGDTVSIELNSATQQSKTPNNGFKVPFPPAATGGINPGMELTNTSLVNSGRESRASMMGTFISQQEESGRETLPVGPNSNSLRGYESFIERNIGELNNYYNNCSNDTMIGVSEEDQEQSSRI